MSYKIVTNPDGTATVRRVFSGSVVGTHPNAEAAEAWIDEQVLADQADQEARDKGLTGRCHYCGLPTVQGYCRECGTEI